LCQWRTRSRSFRLIACPVLLLFNLSLASPSSGAQQSPLPPAASPEEVRAYEAFRAWITTQPSDVRQADDDVVYRRCAERLRAQGQSQKDAASTIELLKKIGDRAEIERWNPGAKRSGT
jgi:hypothetical protein